MKIVSQSTNSVNSKVSSTKYINFKNLLPGQKKTYTYDFTMKFTSNNFTVTGTSKHGSGRSYSHTDKFYKNYKDSDFPSWSRGTFPNKVRSLDYHIGKHGTEVGTQNIIKYYGLALTERRNAIVGGK